MTTPSAEPADGGAFLEGYRTPFEVLTERTIGTTSRPVRFDWRKNDWQVGVIGSDLVELNDFLSGAYGGFVRRPFSGIVGELDVTRVQTWSTGNSNELALTPYRQYGRPSRFELDLNASVPLAEGIVTAWPRFFPAAQMVFSVTGGLRYLFYPNAWSGAHFSTVASNIFAPQLSSLEEQNLLERRPPGMQVDPGRYQLLAGFTTDIYFQSGFFLFPRAMIGLPLLEPATQSQLGFWWELSLGMGWAF
jgi:hypothetical protein